MQRGKFELVHFSQLIRHSENLALYAIFSLRSQTWLGPSASPLFMTNFPLLGADMPEPGSFTWPYAPADPKRSVSRSIFVGDEVLKPHPRYGTLTANIRRYVPSLFYAKDAADGGRGKLRPSQKFYTCFLETVRNNACLFTYLNC